MSALQTAYSSPPREGIWPSLNRFLLVLIGVTISSAILLREQPQLTGRSEQEHRIDALKAEIDHEKQLLIRRQRMVALLLHDPDYLGTVARDRLGIMKPGETIFRVGPDLSRMHRRE